MTINQPGIMLFEFLKNIVHICSLFLAHEGCHISNAGVGKFSKAVGKGTIANVNNIF
jgi:hypothetical protein